MKDSEPAHENPHLNERELSMSLFLDQASGEEVQNGLLREI